MTKIFLYPIGDKCGWAAVTRRRKRQSRRTRSPWWFDPYGETHHHVRSAIRRGKMSDNVDGVETTVWRQKRLQRWLRVPIDLWQWTGVALLDPMWCAIECKLWNSWTLEGILTKGRSKLVDMWKKRKISFRRDTRMYKCSSLSCVWDQPRWWKLIDFTTASICQRVSTLERASATTFSLPDTWWMSVEYCATKFRCRVWREVNFSAFCWKGRNVIGLRSVYTANCRPSSMCRKYFTPAYITKSSRLYLVCALDRRLE